MRKSVMQVHEAGAAALAENTAARGDQPATRPLRVMMLGLRGCPNVQGGVERHVEELAPRLAQLGANVEIITRAPYVESREPRQWRGTTLHPLPASRSRAFEAIVHTALGVLHAAWQRPDILHIHAIGPALLTPLARAFGLRVVITHHGFDYDRGKWGRAAKILLRLGERWGMKYANARIAVSSHIAQSVLRRYEVRSDVFPNGVTIEPAPSTTQALQNFGLDAGRYIAMVGRLVPEKRHADLVAAFARAAIPNWKLALIGGADHPDAYSRSVQALAESTPNVVATGFQSGTTLQQLLAYAGLFVLPSSHEGLPIALLEAIGYRIPVLASDIPANREVGLANSRYFPVGDVDVLASRLQLACTTPTPEAELDAERIRIAESFDWDRVAERTLALYRSVVGQRPSSSDTDVFKRP